MLIGIVRALAEVVTNNQLLSENALQRSKKLGDEATCLQTEVRQFVLTRR